MYPIVVSNSYFIFEPCSIRFIYRDLFVHSEHPVIRKISMWFKEICMFFVYQRISSNRYDDESRSLLCFCLCHALLFVYHKETDHQVKCFVLDPGYFSDLWNVFRVWIWKWIVLWTHGFLTRNTINTIFRCTLICLVFLNLIMFGYLLHHIRKGFRVVHQTKTVQFSQRETRTVRKISVFTGMFLAAFSPFMMIYTFPILDMTSSIEKSIYTISATLVLLNSACNPVLYVWRFSEPRYRIKKLLCFWNKKKIMAIDQKYSQQTASYSIYSIQK